MVCDAAAIPLTASTKAQGNRVRTVAIRWIVPTKSFTSLPAPVTGIYKDSKRNFWLRVRFPATTRSNGTQSNTATSPHREWFTHSLRCELLHPLAVLTEPESFPSSGRARVHKNAATHDVLPCVEGDQAHRRRLASLTDSSTCGPVTVNRAPSCRLGMARSATAAR